MTLMVHTVVTGRWRENCYVVHEDGQRDAVVIDPGAAIDEIQACIAEEALEIGAILLTHGHFDHIGAVSALRRLHGVDCLVHPDDQKLVRRANLYRAIFDADEPIEIPSVEPLPIGQSSFGIAGLDIEAIHTPGHTPGGVCFRIGDDLFSGDTFHRGRTGRVDLPGGDAAELARSIKRLGRLAPGIRVYPGHGAETTIGAECESGALALAREAV